MPLSNKARKSKTVAMLITCGVDVWGCLAFAGWLQRGGTLAELGHFWTVFPLWLALTFNLHSVARAWGNERDWEDV